RPGHRGRPAQGLLPPAASHCRRRRAGGRNVARHEPRVRLPHVRLRSHENDTRPLLFRNRRGLPDFSCLRLLGGSPGEAMKASTGQDYHERIVRTLVYVQEHLDDTLELEQVASVAAFSSFHFHRIFRGLVGETLREYVRRLRLERAARNLKRLDEPITTIALNAGFETHESFTRAFGDMFGLSPSAFRNAHKPAPESQPGYQLPDYGDPPPVEVKELPPMRVVFLRHVGAYNQVGATW